VLFVLVVNPLKAVFIFLHSFATLHINASAPPFLSLNVPVSFGNYFCVLFIFFI